MLHLNVSGARASHRYTSLESIGSHQQETQGDILANTQEEARSDRGRQLLSRLLAQLNLPPEEWADDVKVSNRERFSGWNSAGVP